MPVACPTLQGLICVWLVHPPLSLLISSTDEEVLQETAAQALSTDLACVSGLFQACLLRSLQLQPREPEEREQKTLTLILSQVLICVLTDSGKGPSRCLKLKSTTWW